jgi:hypothetical protein
MRTKTQWRTATLIAVAAAFLLNVTTFPCLAQNLIIYPAKGQSTAQQEQDRYACHVWATQQSGYNLIQPSSQAPPYGGGLVRGAARGAAVGSVGGAIGGNAGKGAAIGAATGALIGGMRRRDQYTQQQSATSQQQSLYNRALGTCMQARGYSVG